MGVTFFQYCAVSPPFVHSIDKVCAVSPPTRICFSPTPNVDVRLDRKLEFYGYLDLSMLCGVPTQLFAPSTKYVRCPHHPGYVFPQPQLFNHQESMCGVAPLLAPCSENMCSVPPPGIHFFCAVPPRPVYNFSLALSWTLSKIENPASSSLQDKAKLNLHPRVWHS